MTNTNYRDSLRESFGVQDDKHIHGKTINHARTEVK